MVPLLHIPKRRLFLVIALYAVFIAVLALSLPWFVFMPVAMAIAAVHISVESRRVTRRYQDILDSVRTIHGDAIGDMTRIRPQDANATIYKAFKEMAAELERKNFQLVEKNIQLLGMKEIGLTLVSSLDESRLVDAVINFLTKGLGYRELFVGIFHPEESAFNFYMFRDTASGHTYEERSLPLAELDGLLRKSMQMHQSVLIRDPDMHPMGSRDGRPLFPDSTMKSYVVVPMVKSNATRDCDAQADCILNMTQVRREATSVENAYSCPACNRVPILGVLGVTDGFKAASLSKVDLVSVETLAVQLSTILENTRLFSELKQEEGFRDNVINSMMNGLITVDRSGNILLANDTAVQLTGHTHEEIRAMNVSHLIRSPNRSGNDPVMNTLRTGRKSFQAEALLLKKGDRHDPIILNTSLLLDRNREIQGVLAVFDDIARIRRMEEQIVHLDKLAALGRFSSSIAHEIRNPLTGIAAGIQYLRRAGHIPDSQHENIDFILEEVTRIDRLIGDLMNVVRMGDLIYTETSLESVIANSVHSMAELARQRSVKVSTGYPEPQRAVTVDAERIVQVMINLVKNAIEASTPSGEVTITVTFPENAKDVLFDALRDFAIIEVRDQGIGLTEEDRTRVFEPFFSKKAGGTGLGLYVTHSIVERHGGFIYVDSTYGVGSTFTVYLPVEQVEHGDSRKIRHPTGR